MQLLFDSNGKNLLVTPHYHHKSVFLQLSFHTALKSVYTDSLTNEDFVGEIAAVKSLIYQELQGITWTFQGKFVQICWNFQGIYQVSLLVMAGTLICDKPIIKAKTYTCNQQQNELRHFALNWAFLLTHPLHAVLCQCSSYLQKMTNTPTLNGRGGACEGCGFFCPLQLPYLSTMSQLFCCRLWLLLHIKNRQTLSTKPAREQAMHKRERAACKERCVR